MILSKEVMEWVNEISNQVTDLKLRVAALESVNKVASKDSCPMCGGDLRWLDGIIHAKICQKCFTAVMRKTVDDSIKNAIGENNG